MPKLSIRAWCVASQDAMGFDSPHGTIVNFQPYRITAKRVTMEKQIYRITMKVVDLETKAVTPSIEKYVSARKQKVAEGIAIRAFKKWRLACWKYDICSDYDLTSEQLNDLITDGIITPPELADVTVIKAETVSKEEAYEIF